MRILQLFADTILEAEIGHAFASLGHQVERFDVQGTSSVLDPHRFAVLLDGGKFDLVFTINSQGFDAQGRMSALLEQTQLPTITWEIDHPYAMQLLGLRSRPSFASLYTFVWDEGYLADMHSLGWQRVFYLPLGIADELIQPLPERPCPSTFHHDFIFVGSSLRAFWHTFATRLFPQSLVFPPELEALPTDALRNHLVDTSIPFIEHLRTALAPYAAAFNTPHERLLYELRAEIFASMNYREWVIRQLPGLQVYGDVGWRDIAPGKYRGSVHYGPELFKLYGASRAVLNCTLVKNRFDANQRIFDVFAAGSYPISDLRKNLETCFPQQELAVYHHPRDLQSMLRELAPDTRMRDIQRGHAWVDRAHRLSSRLETMLGIVCGNEAQSD